MSCEILKVSAGADPNDPDRGFFPVEKPCTNEAIGTDENGCRVCKDCAEAQLLEGFSVTFDIDPRRAGPGRRMRDMAEVARLAGGRRVKRVRCRPSWMPGVIVCEVWEKWWARLLGGAAHSRSCERIRAALEGVKPERTEVVILKGREGDDGAA